MNYPYWYSSREVKNTDKLTTWESFEDNVSAPGNGYVEYKLFKRFNTNKNINTVILCADQCSQLTDNSASQKKLRQKYQQDEK